MNRSQRILTLLGGLVAQFVFIAAGVYLAMQADAYKEERSHREAARAALENFRAEMLDNRAIVTRYAPYHESMLDSMVRSQKRGDPPPKSVREVMRRVGFHGLEPVTYGHTAWDLALATQSLSYLPPKLAFSIAKVYASQTRIEELQSIAMNQLFSPSSLDNARWEPFARALGSHLEDMHFSEPGIIKAYDTIVPRIDSALKTLPR